mgnify:CR=1 FL=1
MERQRARRATALLGVVALAVACAARQASLEDTALTVGELALTVDRLEREAFAAGLYGADRHAALGTQVLQVLRAARALERAAAAGRDGTLQRQELAAVLDDLARVVQDIPPLMTAVRAVQQFLAGAV